MFKSYVGNMTIVNAKPEERDKTPGYTIITADGYASWIRAYHFERTHREISPRELQLLKQTDAEAQISAISDGISQDEMDSLLAEADDDNLPE